MKSQNFGEYLRNLRKAKGIKIRELAEKSGLNHSAISRIERNERGVPKATTIKKLALGLDEPYETLMEKAGYLTQHTESEDSKHTENEYDYTKDPTLPPELRKLLDALVTLPPGDQQMIINKAIIIAEGIKSKKTRKGG
jgi:transcriptional regulator with XRE-family HTH domain